MEAMDNLRSILGNKSFEPPDEIAIIKEYVEAKFKSQVDITMHPRTIVISAKTSSLAGTLRLHLHELTELCKTDKKLIIRIG